MKRFATLLFLAVTAAADERFVCGNDERTLQRVEAVSALARRLPQNRIASQSVPSIEKRDDVYIVRTDELTAPFWRKFDLADKTLQFTPAGEGAYSVRTVPLEIRARGRQIDASYRLEHFAFPFGGQQVRDLRVSTGFAIHLGAAADYDTYQLAPFELASVPGGVISPLYRTTRQAPRTAIQLFVDDTPEGATFTWAGPENTEVQAVLFPNGEIRFSYPRVPTGAGGVLITTGNEIFREQRTELASVTDTAEPGNDGVRPMLDIERVSVSRVADLDLLEFRMDVRGNIDPNVLGANDVLRYEFAFDGAPADSLVAELRRSGGPIYYSTWSGGTSPAASFSGRSLTLRVDQELLAGLPQPLRIRAVARSGSVVDVASYFEVTPSAPPRRVGIDLSALDGETLSMPIVESFTLPVLNPDGVWTRLREQLPALMKDDTIDAVAIYQTFPTDLVFYASAYSTAGHSGAIGIRPNDAPRLNAPRTPALLHMNEVGKRVNVAERAASHVLLHELGHRWLLFIQIMENGAKTNVLKPAGAHPAQWVDTRAAFRVYTDRDASVMGGGVFTPNGDGSFTTGPYGFYGYSWLDLYLMGLASADEVRPFMYLANSNPALGPAYYAPQGTYRGDRRDVTVQQVIEGTGPRHPVYPDTQRVFRMAIVLLTDREPTAQELEFMQMYRRLGERDFRIATGGRGELTTTLSGGPRRRAARH